MPRAARLDASGVLHHVIVRGIEKGKIFTDNTDRENFLSRLETLIPETKTTCYAWSLIPNHVHLLVRTGSDSLSSFMARLLTGYAVSYNRRHKRHGHLFQNRYKSIICEEDPYFLELVRYIHLNPLRAKIVPDMNVLNRYPYGGHSTILGRHKRAWQDTASVLSRFGPGTIQARRRYLGFIRKGINEGTRTDLTGGGLVRSLGGWEEATRHRTERVKSDQRILGSSDFVLKILAEKEESLHRTYQMRQQGYTFGDLQQKVAGLFSLDPEDLSRKTKERKYVDARSVLCYCAYKELGILVTEMARRLSMTQPAVTYAVKRGKVLVEERGYSLDERNL